jgi:hypothetical protein
MNTVSTTFIRSNMAEIINSVASTGMPVVFGRRDIPEAVIIQYPKEYNKKLSDLTNMAMYGGSFDFLKDEKDIYSIKDLKKKYV